MVPHAQINDFKLHLLGDQGGSDVGIDTLILHDLFIWKKFLDILVQIKALDISFVLTPGPTTVLTCNQRHGTQTFLQDSLPVYPRPTLIY